YALLRRERHPALSSKFTLIRRGDHHAAVAEGHAPRLSAAVHHPIGVVIQRFRLPPGLMQKVNAAGDITRLYRGAEFMLRLEHAIGGGEDIAVRPRDLKDWPVAVAAFARR